MLLGFEGTSKNKYTTDVNGQIVLLLGFPREENWDHKATVLYIKCRMNAAGKWKRILCL